MDEERDVSGIGRDASVLKWARKHPRAARIVLALTAYLPLCYLVNEASPVTLIDLGTEYGFGEIRASAFIIPLCLALVVGYVVFRMYVWLWEGTDDAFLLGMLICPFLLGFAFQAFIGPYSGPSGIDYIGAAIVHTYMYMYGGAVISYVSHVGCAVFMSRNRLDDEEE